MSIKRATQIGEGVIRQKAALVKNALDKKAQQIIKDLVDSMRHDNLVGMAAPQIGRGLRIFVTEIRHTTYRKNISKPDPLRVFINPRIVWRSKRKAIGYEGCGSVASSALFGLVKRPASVICRALDKNGEPFTVRATGLLARAIQHEMDHLNGIVFIDQVSTKSLVDKETYINGRG